MAQMLVTRRVTMAGKMEIAVVAACSQVKAIELKVYLWATAAAEGCWKQLHYIAQSHMRWKIAT